jgi:hypothetical protein
MPKILGGEARGRKKVRMAIKWDRNRKKFLLVFFPCFAIVFDSDCFRIAQVCRLMTKTLRSPRTLCH